MWHKLIHHFNQLLPSTAVRQCLTLETLENIRSKRQCNEAQKCDPVGILQEANLD